MVRVDPLQVGPGTTTVLWWRGPLTARTDRVATSWVYGQHRFESEVTDPVIDKVVDVAARLPPMEAQRREQHLARIHIDVRATQPWISRRVAMDVKRVEIGVAPREDDLQRRMEGGQRHVAADEEPAPNQRTDALHDHTELIDARGDA